MLSAFEVEHGSPATNQRNFKCINPHKVPLVVAWTASAVRKAYIGWPCAYFCQLPACVKEGTIILKGSGSAVALDNP
jgi:hypothetical protein